MKKLIFILFIIIFSVAGYYGYDYYLNEYSVEKILVPDIESKLILIKQGEILKKYIPEQAFSEIGSGKSTPDYLLKELDFSIFKDEAESVVSVVDKNNFLRYEGSDYSKNLKFIDEYILFPKEDFNELINVSTHFNFDTNTVLYINNFDDYTKGTISEDGFVYGEADENSSKIARLRSGDIVFVYEISEKWSMIVTGNLDTGYTLTGNIIDKKNYISNLEREDSYNLFEGKINLTWEAVYSKNPNTDNIPEMQGLNGISPTWFSLKNSQGDLDSKVSDSYISWAKRRGYQLWPLFTNSFDPDMTHEFLNSTAARSNFIQYIIGVAVDKGFDGINIDFENVYLEDKDALTHFVAELSYHMRKNNLVSSMDVTVMGGSDNWSNCFDREALIKYLDYLIVMAYDQYWASSPYSGPVASYDWVDSKVSEMISIVPPEKLILGMPLYMRIWYETPSKEKVNYMDAKSKAIGMESFNNLNEEKKFDLIWSESGKHYYVGYIEDGMLKKIWVEDGRSIGEKTSLVNKHGLAGVATWRRGFETQDIWSIIDEKLSE